MEILESIASSVANQIAAFTLDYVSANSSSQSNWYYRYTFSKKCYFINVDDPERNKEFNYQEMKMRDRRRWEKADLDKDDKLTKQELTGFLHPEEIDHMKDVMVVETLEDIDKDKDGRISLEEYIGKDAILSCNLFYITRKVWIPKS